MSQDEINAILFRKLKSGAEFDRLIPKTTCQSTYVGDGMTDFSMKQMAEVVKEYSWQADLLADVLERKSLQETVFAIHNFLYDHFQYRADKAKQFLRTLACSWYDRAKGIDCKSYSIAASSILTALEIRHSIRRIKQAGFAPNEWTHVYVIVPKNQKTGNLNEGYYTIDGTIPEKDEPDYTEKNDLNMEHFVLNGPARSGLNGGINLTQITGLFSSFSCIGGSGFTEGAYKTGQTVMADYYTKLIADINASIVSKNFAEFSKDVNELFGLPKVCVLGYEKKKSEGWNKCTTDRINGMIAMSKFFRDNVGAALNAYLAKYFTKTAAGGSIQYQSAPLENQLKFPYLYTGTTATHSEPLYSYSFAPGVSTIPAFEITQYVASTAGGNTDGSQFLSTLANTLINLLPGSSGTGTNPGTIPGATDGYYNQPGNGTIGNTTTKQAGFGGIVGWVLIAGALGYVFTQMPDEGPKAKQKKSTSKQ